VSPDEGISASLGITPWGTVMKLLRAYGHDEHIALAMAGQIDDVYQAHRASGEGGSTSALRASAPEGTESDARRLMQAAIRYGQLVAIGRVLRDMDRDAASQGSFYERDEIDRTARASADAMSHCMTLMAKIQSDGAAPSPTPEGLTAPDASAITVERVERIQSILAEAIGLLRNDDTASPQVEYLAVMALDEAMHLLDHPAPPQADAKANLARAPHSLAPEGFTITEALQGNPVRVVATLTKTGAVTFPADLTLDEAKRAIAELMPVARSACSAPEWHTAEHTAAKERCAALVEGLIGRAPPTPEGILTLAEARERVRAQADAAEARRQEARDRDATTDAIVCPGCDGLGREPDECDGIAVERSCRQCDGTGKVPPTSESIDSSACRGCGAAPGMRHGEACPELHVRRDGSPG
jgi:hypothetical protein